jgi:hypothetical protein
MLIASRFEAGDALDITYPIVTRTWVQLSPEDPGSYLGTIASIWGELAKAAVGSIRQNANTGGQAFQTMISHLTVNPLTACGDCTRTRPRVADKLYVAVEVRHRLRNLTLSCRRNCMCRRKCDRRLSMIILHGSDHSTNGNTTIASRGLAIYGQCPATRYDDVHRMRLISLRCRSCTPSPFQQFEIWPL